MQHQVAVCLLGDITVRVDDSAPVRLTAKSRIGASLMEYLIMQRGQPVSGARLIRELWKDRTGRNPENALKTMISRLRSLLHGICVGLGDCVANGASGYYWQTLPWVQVDVLDLMDCMDRLRQRPPEAEKRELLERIMVEYTDDLYNSGDISNGSAMVNYLHKEYLDAACALVEMMRAEKAWGEICRVCRRALEIDGTDRQLRAEMADAAEWLERGERRRSDRRDDRQDADENEESLSRSTETGRQLRLNLDLIARELQEKDRERQGPFFCDYPVFKEIYNIQMRNLERLGSTMFLGVMMVTGENGGLTSVSRESAMAALMEILRNNLRKGDIVTRLDADLVAMLLPTVNYSTGSMVMGRIEKLFGKEYPRGGVTLQYRVNPLGNVMA